MAENDNDPKGPEDNNGDGNSGQPSGSGSGGDSGNNGEKVTMTQAALDKLFTERADRASRSAVTALLKELGYEDADALKAVLTEYSDIQDGKKTELQKAQDDLEAATTRAETAETALEESQNSLVAFRRRSSIVDAARENAFLSESLDDVWLLVQNDSDLDAAVTVDDESGKVSGAETVVKKVAKLRPHWVQTQQMRGTPQGRGAPLPPKGQEGGEPEGRQRPLVSF